jgi:hypothetical protein
MFELLRQILRDTTEEAKSVLFLHQLTAPNLGLIYVAARDMCADVVV